MVYTNKYFNFRFLGLLSLFAILILQGCSPELNLAKRYIRNHKDNRIVIIPSYQLFKDNLTISYNTYKKYSPQQFDSIAWVQSCYIKHVSDSVFLTRFTNSLINELDKEGFDVYVDGGADINKTIPDPKWIVRVAQLQLNENHTITQYEVSTEKVSGIEYSIASLRLNMLTLSSWFEAGRADTGYKQLLFLEESLMDNRTLGFDFILNRGNKGLQQNRDSIQIADIYYMADESGRKHAELVFDHFMNEYIGENLPAGTVERKYYFYDRKRNTLRQGLNEWTDVEKETGD